MPTTATPRMKHAIAGPVRSVASRLSDHGHAPRSGRPPATTATPDQARAHELARSRPDLTYRELVALLGCSEKSARRRVGGYCRATGEVPPPRPRRKCGAPAGPRTHAGTPRSTLAATHNERGNDKLTLNLDALSGADDETRIREAGELMLVAIHRNESAEKRYAGPPREADEAKVNRDLVRKIAAEAKASRARSESHTVEWYREQQRAYFGKHPLRRTETYRGESVFYIGRDAR